MFLDRLERLTSKIDNVLAASLIAADGIPIETVPSTPEIDVELLAAELMAQVQSIDRNHAELGVGPVRELTITTERAVVSVGSIGEGYFLLLVQRAGVARGRARFELRRAVLDFEDDLA